MSLLEVLVALVIAAGVVAAAVEASHLAQVRVLRAQLEFDAVAGAEALLARAGAELPLRVGRLDGVDGTGLSWRLDVAREGQTMGSPEAFQVTADVLVVRDGHEVRQRLKTLKIVRER
jgi:hypothetical protein